MTEIHQSIPVTVLIGIGTTFLAIIIMTILILRNRFLTRTVRFGIVTEGGHLERTRIHRKKITRLITIGDNSYLYDKKAEITTTFGKEIFYHLGDPRPIIISKNKDELEDKYNSKNIKTVLEAELLEKLLKTSKSPTESILLFLVMGLVLISIIMLFGIKSKGVTIENSPENIELLKNVIVQAIQTGV